MSAHLRLVEDLPSAEVLAVSQHIGAVDLLHEDKSNYPQFKRLESVHRMTGTMAPGEVWMLGAQVGAGKSLFCQNLMDDLIEQGVPTLYIGTEQDAEVLKVKHACMRAGVSPRLMLKPNREDVGTTAFQMATDAVQDQLNWLRSNAVNELALFANCEYVNRDQLRLWINGGVKKYDIRAVIVDHVDQVDHGSGHNPVTEATATIQELHTMGRRHAMPIFVANQIRRSPDPFKRYQPPEIDDFAGTSAKERIASIALGLWRPLRTDLDFKELRELLKQTKHGGAPEDRIYQPNTMGVRKLKDRLGSAPGEQVMLSVCKGGRLEDDLASTHGIKNPSYFNA